MCNVNQLLFADDTALVPDSQERLRQLVEKFWRVCERRKLMVNVSKSKVMKLMKSITMVDDRRMNVALDGKLFEEIECCKYYGHVLHLLER